MSRYFLHTEYAEDQPLARTILTSHVLTRAVTTGAVIGTGIHGARELLQKLRAATSSKTTTATPRARLAPYLRLAGRSTLWTTGISSLGLVAWMWGCEEIKWKDRSWRLLENKGQVETDDWTCGGMALGPAAAVFLSKRPVGWVAAVGAVGAGSVVGTLGYMGWRYGIHGGKFEENPTYVG
ncbi:hypothetical protein F5Y17DRAFT_97206 [Xylariaceae sp. FL0594]|nr:hypothetical protein F5Y17DRAFT_97206 [Xylariaceae sp. FL0594]